MESGMEENFSPVDPEVYEEKPIKTAADRFRETVNMPDFGIPEIQTNDEIFKQAPTPIPLDVAHKLVDGAKIREDVGEQTAVAVENALTGIGGFGDQAILAFGQLTNAVTGNALGTDFMETATKNLEMRMEDMQYAEDSVGGVRNLVAQLAGGAVSMGELLLVSAATGGMGGYLQMGVQAFGEGAFNDMEKYKAEHDGSLKGYEPKSADVAINAGNAILQAVIERKFGVSSPRFFVGASRGLIGEGASGFLQEASQSALADLAEYAKGNKEVAGWLDDAEGWIRDGIVGGLLQGGLGAATYNYNHNNAIKFVAKARAQSQGRETPNKEDSTFAKNIVNAKERGYASVLANEFKAAFDANTGEGKLQAKIATELNRAVKAKELDLDTADETELAQRVEQIATQETLNAMDFAREQNRLISDIELNNIVYKDNAIWLEGLTPEVGDKAVSYARVLAERQSGLAELQTRIDANTRELQQLKADLAEAKAQKQESRAQVLQARIDKQNAIAEKNRLRAQKLEAQTAKLEKQIAKQAEQVKVAEPVKMAEVKAKKVKPVTERKSLKEERIAKTAPSADTGNILKQGSVSGKGDTNRGGYDDQLKRIILGEKSDLSTIQHEFAHYWMQNNFKWARSGLASQDWLRKWRDVEEWLGIEPQDRLLSKSASEKFAKAYERYILEGKVAPELQWAFEGFQKVYQDIYDDLENEYFDLSEELAPEVVDWFNRNKEQSPKRLLEADEKKLEKALTLAAGGAVVEQTGDNTVVMTENNDKGEPVVTMGVKQSEVPQGDNLLVYSDKTTASKLQQSARKVFGDDVQVQQLATLDTEATLENFTNWIKRDRAGAWDAMMSPNTSPIYQAYLYKAFSQEAMNDASLAVELANVNIAKSAREMGQALQALNINNESGFDMMEIIRNLEKSKGEISQEEINNSIAESGVFDVELSEEETNELENQTECKL